MDTKKIRQLEESILRHKTLYYQGVPTISDEEFDALEESLKILDPKNPVLSHVGHLKEGGKKIRHAYKMLSLNKVYDINKLFDWQKDRKVMCSYKLDGSSCSLVYVGGKLNIAKTRGDGIQGENIIQKVLFIKNIPKSISFKETFEVRGEIVCREQNFIQLCDEMEEGGLDRPSSQRNIVSGSLSRKEMPFLCRHFSFFAFEFFSENLKVDTEMDRVNTLKDLSFCLPQHSFLKERKHLKEYVDMAQKQMSRLDILTDGLVFSFNDLLLHKELGETAHHPRYKMALKFQGEVAETKIESIKWSVSRNGFVTPIAEVNSIKLSGAVISRVSLHNFGMIKAFRLKEGDIIKVVRSGEVIPKFLEVIRPSKGKFLYPDKCPSCKSKLKEETIRLICLNKRCPHQQREQILHYIQKIGIENISVKRVEEMLDKKIIKDIPSLYDLTEEKLKKLNAVKETLISKYLQTIEKSKTVELSGFLSALGIMSGGQNKCEKIVKAGNDSIEKIFSLTKQRLLKVESFAEKSAEIFLKSLKEKTTLIQSLLKKGVSIKKHEIKKGSLFGKKICVTGKLSRSRAEIEKQIIAQGGSFETSVSSKTSFLVCNDKLSTSSKIKKAKQYKVPVITEKKMLAMIKKGE